MPCSCIILSAYDCYSMLPFISVGSAPPDSTEYPSDGYCHSSEQQGKQPFLIIPINPMFLLLHLLIALGSNASNAFATLVEPTSFA